MIIGIPEDQLAGDEITTFRYTIREYDAANKQVIVDYDDGSWAKISLYEPLPGDRVDLEKYIRQFTDPIERELAKEDDTDMSFVEDMVGKEFETGRRWLDRPHPAPEPIDPEDEAAVDDIIDDELGPQNPDSLQAGYEMLKLLDAMNKLSFLVIPGVFETLTTESQASVMAVRDDTLRQLKAAQNAVDTDTAFKALVATPDIVFKKD
jgi:hypothetical protein